MKLTIIQTLSVALVCGVFSTPSVYASSGEAELICDAKGGLLLEAGKISYAEGDAAPKELASKELSQTPISVIVNICETKGDKRYSSTEETVLINMEHDSQWDAGQKTNSLFLCTAASDSFPNDASADTNCVRNLTTIQAIKDPTLGTQNFVDGEPVDKLPAAGE